MNAHRRIRLLLYDFARGELDGSAQDEVRRHLTGCTACSESLAAIGRTIARIPEDPRHDPSSECPPEFWQELLANMERQLPPRPAMPAWRARILEWTDELTGPVRRPSLALGAVLLLALSSVVAWRLLRVEPAPQVAQTAQVTPPASVPVRPVDARMQNYLRKSRILLVGIANMPAGEKTPLDLQPERETSRILVQEARYLRQQEIDPQSVLLIDDMEKVLIELANIRDREEQSDLSMIRGGIERENLLFKIRITETLYDRLNDAGQNKLP